MPPRDRSGIVMVIHASQYMMSATENQNMEESGKDRLLLGASQTSVRGPW